MREKVDSRGKNKDGRRRGASRSDIGKSLYTGETCARSVCVYNKKRGGGAGWKEEETVIPSRLKLNVIGFKMDSG